MDGNEDDNKESILNEISSLRQELASLDENLYLINIRRKLINHRIADLEYELRNDK